MGSLFSGIGGLELGLERAGMRVVWQVEKDDYCRRVLAKHWPDIERFEDVKEVGAHNLKPVDLICGGFPCQDISYAGKGAGLSGERSGLWYEFARIIREMGPRIVVVENVAALANRGLDAVLGTLADIGYDAEWDCVSAADVGAPHLRKRMFIVAYNDRSGLPRPRLGESQGRRTDAHPGGRGTSVAHPAEQRCRSWGTGRPDPGGARQPEQSLQNVADAKDSDRRRANGAEDEGRRDSEAGGRSVGGCGLQHWRTEPNVGRVADGVPSRIHRLTGLGNAVVPQVAEYIGRLIVEADRELRETA